MNTVLFGVAISHVLTVHFPIPLPHFPLLFLGCFSHFTFIFFPDL
jgi:hypothetical protein